MTINNRQTLIIPETHQGERLDQALAKLFPDYSRTQLKEWLESGRILVNGQAYKAKTKVKGGETITLEAVFKPQPVWEAQDIPLSIVYEDEELLVINKPIGLVVHPGAGNLDATLLNALLHHAPVLKALPRAGIIHRLDKNTSGLLMVAKTSLAFKRLTDQLKHRRIQRVYQAIVQGRLISGGTIAAPIGRHPRERKRMAVCEEGKPAITHYRIIEKYRAHTLLKVFLETGRTHQIRVHLAHLRHPIVGDPLYGGRQQLIKGISSQLHQQIREFKHQALHAYALGLTHPISLKELHLEIDLPKDMQQLIQALREDQA